MPGAVFEEGFLSVHDLTGSGEDGLLPLINGANDGAPITDLIAKIIARFSVVGGGREEVLVFVVDTKAGKVTSSERSDPFIVVSSGDLDIGLDVGISVVLEAGAG